MQIMRMGYKENELNFDAVEVDKSSKMVKELGQRWKRQNLKSNQQIKIRLIIHIIKLKSQVTLEISHDH